MFNEIQSGFQCFKPGCGVLAFFRGTPTLGLENLGIQTPTLGLTVRHTVLIVYLRVT